MASLRDLPELLDALDPQAELVQRHLWLIALFEWLRGDCRSVPATLARIQLLLDAVQARPELQARVQAWWQALVDIIDGSTLLADYGFSSRSAFVSEFAERLYQKLLPGTPETTDASALFSLVLGHAFDAQWLAALDETTLERLAVLLQPAQPAQDDYLRPAPSPWQDTVLEALTFCTSQVRATGFSPELRLRMSAPAREAGPFHALDRDFDALRDAYLASPAQDSAERQAALQQLRERLEACRSAAASVYTHLDAHGISVNLVFQLRQLRERVLRIRALLDCLLSGNPLTSTTRLLAQLVTVGQERRSVRALIASNSSMLAAKVAERSSETGEHYITRNWAQYRDMLRDSAGGGAVMSIGTLVKFMVFSLSLSVFWSGFFAGLNYALCFVFIQFMHWTVATKQPAMTAPAMAVKLKDLSAPGAVDVFVTEVTHLVRSQVAAVVGNQALVAPCVLLISFALWQFTGEHMLNAVEATHVLDSLTLLGPTALFAAFTGVLLFASSIIAGWVENWFVLHRMDSSLRYNPRITAALGTERAARWAHFMRENISGLAGNISLGFMLGLTPAFATFFGLGLEVRHVTLSTGQLAAASATLGLEVLHLPVFWWCIAGLVVTSVLNVGVSYYLAFRLALRAHNVSGVDRSRIRSAIWARWRSMPLSFFWPVKAAVQQETVNG
ncbi:site-specific recombinase [Rhodoferax ferrireducens]|uniref:site-specific recombinase n=1 Tax=Rhodoferax ferrireducens TaxID=192843 RepID=UPI001E512C96|nr:site-specific recombinase [Rhodoferax ferrireducens]